MSAANRIEGIGGGSPRGVGGISGAGGRNVNPINRPLSANAQKAIDAVREQKNWKRATPAESQAVKTAAKKNSIERAKKGMG